MAKLIYEMLSYFRENWLSLAALLISIISLLITWIKNIKDRQYSEDKALLAQLMNSLELAYNSITIKKDDQDYPFSDRKNWLTSARHIIRYRQLKELLKTKLYKILCDEQEEYWRDRVYELLNKIQDSSFFKYINQGKFDEETIDPTSAAIIYSFAEWKEGLDDLIDTMSFDEVICRYNVLSPKNRHFQKFVEENYPNLAKKVKDKSI